MEDNEIIEGCLRGDPHSWEAFVSKFSSHITRIIKKRAHKVLAGYDYYYVEDVCKDIYQEFFVFLNSKNKLQSFHWKSEFLKWLSVVACNFVIDYVRANVKKHNPLTVCRYYAHDADSDSDVSDTSVDMVKSLLTVAVEGLPEEDRFFVKLAFYNNLSYTSIGRFFAMSKAEVEHKMEEIVQRLKDKI